MRNAHTVFRCALLGSALAVAALAPAAANGARDDHTKRMLAIHGSRGTHANRGAAPVSAPPPSSFEVLHDFGGAPDDGANSGANVTYDNGTLWGTTNFGGANDQGAVYKRAPDGTVTLLHSFSGSDGASPDGAVFRLPGGTLFGTTQSGGANGNGVLYKISKSGNFNILHDFLSADGSFLRGNLIHDGQGNFYGTALFGGANGDGTVFRYRYKGFTGTFSVLHTFNGADGLFPEHGVIRDNDGNLYGVTAFGGDSDNGTVYKLAPDGTLTTLHHFTGGADGGFLYGGLDRDKHGNIYGTTAEGGANNQGTIFKIAANGDFTTLYSFTGGTDGGSPESDVKLAGPSLFGVTNEGGSSGCQCGVVWEFKPRGKLKVLHSFDGSDGGGYSAGLTYHKGNLFGTTSSFGANSAGVLFEIGNVR